MNIKDTSFTFLSNYFKSENFDLEPITNSASNRNYFRVSFEEQHYIFTESNNIKENICFEYYTKVFNESNINTPIILAINKGKSCYLQNDLGKTSLYDIIQKQGKNDTLKSYYKKAIEQLVNTHILVHKNIDYNQSYEFSKFDEKVILNDLFYFKNYFLEYLEIPFQKHKLIDDFIAISNKIKSLPNHFFLFRDFQSRNIMVSEKEVYFIDYQGGMQGILAYDLVSLIWQAKAELSEDWKIELKKYYDQLIVSKTNITQQQLDDSYQISLILRLYQLLGAYGFRGLVQQKSHFKESISKALKNLSYLLEINALEEYTELKHITETKLINLKIS